MRDPGIQQDEGSRVGIPGVHTVEANEPLT